VTKRAKQCGLVLAIACLFPLAIARLTYTSPASAGGCAVTRADYDAIQLGWGESLVQEILGCEGDLASTTYVEGPVNVWYFGKQGGGAAQIITHKRRVVSKAW
jgi:hypothetical protein